MNTTAQISSKSFATDNKVERLGTKLSQARQAKGLNLTDVAQKLRLSVAIIQALEQDQYDKMPGQVFIRGYIKNYVHLLGLNEEELSLSVPEVKSVPKLRPSTILKKQDINSSYILVRIISWLIIFGIIGLIGLWWQGQFTWNDSDETIAQPTVDTNTIDKPVTTDPTTVSPTTSPRIKSTPSNQVPSPSKTIGDSILIPALAMPETEPAIEPESLVTTTQSTKDEDINATNTVDNNPVTATTPPLPPVDQIILKLSGTCWVDVRDSKENFKLVGNMHKGDRHIITGTPPYVIRLGNADAAKITVNNKQYDIQQHSRGGVAKFTLDPTSIH
ncbi:hypothetical protein TI03_02090 [Achromatium sp. WMS1]|nr:hypothetical protein TI03_02090 [Achromatium sp. WMS1]